MKTITSNVEEIVSNGTLVYHEEEVPIKATYASRFSLYVNFLSDQNFVGDSYFENRKKLNNQPDRRFNFITDTIFDKLKMNINGSHYEFGRCRFVSDRENPHFSGKLFFTEEVYDIFEMFSSHKLISLEDHFRSGAIIFPQKNKVHQKFKDYTSNLTFDIKVYKTLFDEMDARYEHEDPVIANVIQTIILQKEGRIYMEFFDSRLDELSEIVSGFNDQEHAAHGYYFRKQLWDIILCSEFMKRTNVKPRGYPGDSRMMEMIYENSYRGNSTFSKLMHKHPLEAPAAQAVRNRVNILGNAINMMSQKRGETAEPLKILSLACGPARELETILTTREQCNEYHFTLFDQDIKAIDEAKNNISNIEHRLATKVNYSIIKDSIRTILSIPDLSGKWGQFNFIYALGLFDYLTDRVAQAVIPKLYNLLLPGGQILIGNFHKKNPNRYYMEYWLDWTLYYRDEQEMNDLTKGIPPVESDLFFDDSKSQMFLKITRS